MKKRKNQKFIATMLISIILFILIITWLVVGINKTSASTDANRLESIRSNVMNSAVLCYSIEGAYPADLQYLIDNYAIKYDEKKYIIHYDCFGGNIRPVINVIPIEM